MSHARAHVPFFVHSSMCDISFPGKLTMLDTFLTFKLIFEHSWLHPRAVSDKARAHMSQKDHKQREWFKVAILEIETSGFFGKGHHLCSKLIFEHSWLLTLMEEAGSISPVLINQLEVLKAQNAFKEKENRVTYLPFFPQRSNRGCSQGCSRTQANLMRLYIKKLFHNA